MDSTLVKLDNSRVKITVDVEADVLEKSIDQAYRRMVKKITVPGFRKGKAPRKIIEMSYGPNIFLEDAIDILLPEAYEFALGEQEISPVDRPDAQLDSVEQGVGATFVFEVDVYPEIELGEYKGLEAERQIVQISDEDVLSVLEQQREQNAQLVVVERQVEHGDFAVIDFVGYLDGQPFSGGAAEDHTIEIGSGQFIPGFEEQLIGFNVGESRDIQVTFPEEYSTAHLAGREATFKVTLKELKEKSLPELDDEFAKDISEYETLDELKDEIRKNLEDEAGDRTSSQLQNTLLELIATDSKAEIPLSMISRRKELLADHFLRNLSYQGITEEKYLEIMEQSRDELLERFEPAARTELMYELIIEAVGEQEGIVVSEEEVNTKIDELVGDFDGEADQQATQKSRDYWNSQKEGITYSLRRQKVLDHIIDQAMITDLEAPLESDDSQPSEES